MVGHYEDLPMTNSSNFCAPIFVELVFGSKNVPSPDPNVLGVIAILLGVTDLSEDTLTFVCPTVPPGDERLGKKGDAGCPS